MRIQKVNILKKVISKQPQKQINNTILKSLLNDKKYTQLEILELLNLPQKSFILYNRNTPLFDKKLNEERIMTSKELIELLRNHKSINSEVLNLILSTCQTPLKDESLTYKELNSILNNKKLVLKLEELKNNSSAQISSNSEQNNPKIINRRIPRFLYHITSKEYYESMLKDGYLKTTKKQYPRGVYAIELPNFFKRWCSSELGSRLFYQAKKNFDEIVILKIPTKKLNKENLFIRSQDRYFIEPSNLRLCYIYAKMKHQDIPTTLLKWLNKYSGIDYMQHIKGETPAIYAKKYKQNKEPIEYIYKENIPVNFIEKIGEISLKNTEQVYNKDNNFNIKKIFLNLLKDTPEIKSVELLKE